MRTIYISVYLCVSLYIQDIVMTDKTQMLNKQYYLYSKSRHLSMEIIKNETAFDGSE